MREVLVEEYLDFASRNASITIDDQIIPLKPIKVTRLEPSSQELPDVSTTVWSFPKRGSWATHKGDYRGNWPPQIPRALILKYTGEGDVVLDPMVGSGTTCVEAVLLGRNCIGVDLNYHAVMLTHHRLYYLVKALEGSGAPRGWYRIYHGDARRLDKIQDDSVDLVATHPPYLNIVRYGVEKSEGDLSAVRGLEEFLALFKEVAREIYRVLKPGKTLAILVGDTRVRKHYVPLTHYVLLTLLDTGFVLMEEVVKIQHKMKTTREVWSRLRNRDFLLIYHEKLFILRKPVGKDSRLRYSGRQDFVELKL
ncbi:methyltransferase domain-containing protein [Thermosphaera chiliense]|uniref:Type II methyltransferase n=1 Tax=Thermosphaera chiliense TaxID=3402707 RepID=A0A7M1USU4_9CREN|nr:DNA methyltransferase [Thermosphaera aggregans]QOR94553.1 methyltransferase domain-containing protein [Thermosphaera aggregans]